MAQLKTTTVNGNLTVSDDIYLNNGNVIYMTNNTGANRSMVQIDSNNLASFGYGSYINNEGASYFDGNDVNIRSKGGIFMTSPEAGLENRQYGMNKVLWSGGMYMTEGHSITLSEPVAAQPNGIVLVFSRYSDDTVRDYDFYHFFISKSHVVTHNGLGSGFMMCDSTGTYMARKYLYISNTEIKGHANNDAVGETSCGITWTNNGFVLRQVIGV